MLNLLQIDIGTLCAMLKLLPPLNQFNTGFNVQNSIHPPISSWEAVLFIPLNQQMNIIYLNKSSQRVLIHPCRLYCTPNHVLCMRNVIRRPHWIIDFTNFIDKKVARVTCFGDDKFTSCWRWKCRVSGHLYIILWFYWEKAHVLFYILNITLAYFWTF